MQLNIRHSDGKTATVALDPAKTLKLGSDKSADVVLVGAGVLPVHCGIVWKQEHFQVVASKAAQTVEVNGSPVQAAVLRDADEFKIGDVTISVSKPEEAEFGLAPMESAGHKAPPSPPAQAAKPGAKAADKVMAGKAATDKPSTAKAAKADVATAPAAPPTPVDEEFSLAPIDQVKPTPPKPAAAGAKGGSPPTPPSKTSATAGLKTTPEPTSAAVPQPVEDEFALAPTDHDKPATPKLAAAKTPATAAKPADPPAPSPQPVEDEFGLAPMAGETHDHKKAPAAPGSKPVEAKGKPTAPAKKEPASGGKKSKLPPGPAEAAPLATSESTNAVALAGNLTGDLFDDELTGGSDLSSPLEPGAKKAAAATKSSAVIPVDEMEGQPGVADGPAGANRAPKPPRNWRVLKVMLAVLALMSIAAGGVWWIITRPSATDVWSLAEQEYQAKAWPTAVQRYATFISTYPDHELLPVARAKLTLARLHPLVATGGTEPNAVSSARSTLEAAGVGDWPDTQKQEMAELVGLLATGVVGAAEVVVIQQAGDVQAALDKGADAIALGQQYVPQNLYAKTGLKQARLTLARLEHAAQQPKRLSQALAQLQSATDPEQAYQALRALRSQTLAPAHNATIKSALEALATASVAGVKFDASPPADESRAAFDPAAEFAFGLTNGAGEQGLPAFAMSAPDGCVYAIDTGRGSLLWRRFVGFETSFVPRLGGGEQGDGALLVDSRRRELQCLDARGGQIRWRAPLGARAADPVLAGGVAWCALANGEARGLNLATGETEARFITPLALSVGPAVDAERGLVYQVADHSLLYVFSIADKSCVGAAALSHARGSVVTPPLLVGRHLLIAENLPAGGSALRAVRLNDEGTGPAPAQTVTLPGPIFTPLVADAGLVCAATGGGGIHVFSLDSASDSEPLKPVATRDAASGDESCAWLSVIGGQLWAAGAGAVSFDWPPASGVLTPKVRARREELFQQAIAPLEQAAIGARRPDQGGGTVVSIWRAGQATPRDLYIGWPVGGALIADGSALRVVHPAGAVYQVGAGDLTGPQALNESFDERSPVETLATDAQCASWPDGLIVLSATGARSLRVWDPAGAEAQAKTIDLPGALACPARRLGNHLVVALEGGPIYLLDPRAGASVGEPFLPDLRVAEPARWMFSVTDEQAGVVATDGQGKLYHLLWSGETSALGKSTSVDLPGLLLAPPAVAGADVWCATETALVKYALPDLATPESAPLAHRPIWGPRVVGGRVLLALADRQLYAYGKELQPAWQAPLNVGRPVAASEVGQRLTLADDRGDVWSLDAATGKPFWRLATGRPLSETFAVSGSSIFAATLDGAVLQIPIPADEGK